MIAGVLAYCVFNGMVYYVAGMLADTFGSYKSVYYYIGGSMLLGASLGLLHPFLKETPEEKEARELRLIEKEQKDVLNKV